MRGGLRPHRAAIQRLEDSAGVTTITRLGLPGSIATASISRFGSASVIGNHVVAAPVVCQCRIVPCGQL